MHLDVAQSNDRQLVYTRPARPRVGLAFAILGLGLGLWLMFGVRTHEAGAVWFKLFPLEKSVPLIFGTNLILIGLVAGLVKLISRQMVLDKENRELVRSWRWLGLSGSERQPLGEPISVG